MPRSPTPEPDTSTRRPRGELGWIQWIQQRAVSSRGGHGGAVALGIGDDCAILRPAPGDELLVTTDFTLEGRHFRRDWHPARSAGHRTLARGLSDLAAMGGKPLAAFLSLALPPADAREGQWTEEFLQGLLALAERFDVPLAGGDTSEAPSEHLLADIVLLGAAPAGTALRRAGARPGDLLYVTGQLGGAAAELRKLATAAGKKGATDDHPQLYPEPRLRVGEVLRSAGLATACMDLSDGLSTDLGHLCEASAVGARVELERLPASPWLSGFGADEQQALLLHGGEDYELLFTIKQTDYDKIKNHPDISIIGHITEPSAGCNLISKTGKIHELKAQGWNAFKKEGA